MTLFKKFAPRIAAAWIIMAASITSAPDASAQRFQYLYCNNNTVPITSGFGGVKQLSDGGYILVGNYSITPTTSSTYIVRTEPDGSLRWAQNYNIGNNDSATNVVVVVDEATNDTSFVVCGVTNNGVGPCPVNRSAFLLKVDKNGDYVAHNTYGSSTSDEIVYDLVETKWDWNDLYGANAGDFVAVGSSTYNSGGGRDGYILRADANLNLIWDAHYGGPGSFDEYFRGVDETVTGNFLFDGGIVAVGATDTWTNGGYDMFIVRILGATSFFHSAASYGGVSDDEGNAIIEIRNGPSVSNLAIAGTTFSRSAPSTNSEVMMVQTTEFPCNPVTILYAGDNGAKADGAMDLKEDEFDGPGADALIVTGFTSFGDPTMTPPNVFVQSFLTGSLLANGGGMSYGGNGDDRGWSVDNAVNISGIETQGYVIAGYSESPSLIGSVARRMYLIKTDDNYTNPCNRHAFEFITEYPITAYNCFTVPVKDMGASCVAHIGYASDLTATQICYTLPRTRRQGEENDGAAGVNLAESDGLAVASYPNPVARDGSFMVQLDATSAANARIAVFDIMGRRVYEREISLRPGSTRQSIEAKGWPAGSYVVRVDTELSSWAALVVVLDE